MKPLTEEQQLGMLIAQQDDARDDHERLVEDFEALKSRFDDLEKLITKKLTTVEAVFKTLRFLGYALVAVLTFHFGDIPKLWVAFFSS